MAELPALLPGTKLSAQPTEDKRKPASLVVQEPNYYSVSDKHVMFAALVCEIVKLEKQRQRTTGK